MSNAFQLAWDEAVKMKLIYSDKSFHRIDEPETNLYSVPTEEFMRVCFNLYNRKELKFKPLKSRDYNLKYWLCFAIQVHTEEQKEYMDFELCELTRLMFTLFKGSKMDEILWDIVKMQGVKSQ